MAIAQDTPSTALSAYALRLRVAGIVGFTLTTPQAYSTGCNNLAPTKVFSSAGQHNRAIRRQTLNVSTCADY